MNNENENEINVSELLKTIKSSRGDINEVNDDIKNINIGTYLRSDYETVINNIYDTVKRGEIDEEIDTNNAIKELYKLLILLIK